jgi:hypothetical protein
MPRQRTEISQPTGINKDLSPYELPGDIWSDGNNINFRRFRTNSASGYSNPFEASLVVRPLYAQGFRTIESDQWAYIGKEDGADAVSIYTTNGKSIKLLESGLNYSRNKGWSGCDFNGGLIFNSREHTPKWLPSPYDKLEDLPNWDANSTWNENSRAEVIRPYKNYAIALDCYDGTGKRYPNMVRWSSPATLGSPPPNWDDQAPGEQAGSYPLADTSGVVYDGLTLGDYFVIYKEDCVYLMQLIFGEFTMSFRKLFGDDAGILAKECVAEFEGQHFVLSPTGAYVHNAASKNEVMDDWVKDELFNNVSPVYLSETKVVADHNNREIWIYYISKDAPIGTGGPYADKALTWNWEDQKWAKRDIPQVSYIAEGYILPSEAIRDDSKHEALNFIDNKALREGLLMAEYDNKIFQFVDYTEGTSLFVGDRWVERIGIDFNDDRSFKYLSRIVPHILGTSPVDISIYTSETQTSTPTFETTITFDPTTDMDIDCHITGRYLGIRFSSQGDFQLNGYTLEWTPTSAY